MAKDSKKLEQIPTGDRQITIELIPHRLSWSWDKILKELSEDLPEEAVERTKTKETHKGYDTTGYKYQYLVDRFNEVLGIPGWGFEHKILKEEQGHWGNGKPFWDITTEVTIAIIPPDGSPAHIRKCVGGHVSSTYADALKGAVTNGFKKTSAFFGVGAKAYAGIIDDDNVPYAEKDRSYTKKEKSSDITEYKQKLLKLLQDIYGADMTTKKKVLKELTTWEKDGKTIEGKDSIYDISEASAKVCYHKLKEATKTPTPDEEAGNDSLLPD